MDVVQEYLSNQPDSKKLKASVFFLETESIIIRMPYENLPNPNAPELRMFWTEILDKLHQRFVRDYNLVDWGRLTHLTRKVTTYHLQVALCKT